jgi:tRNA dimethylallyltransferase
VHEYPATVETIPVIVGPTGSGKSDLGINMALQIDGEIINLDSVQVYRGLYVATAKVPPSERRGVPHHLIDIVEPTYNFTAGEYARVAASTIEEIRLRGRTPILVGGTGFYLRALVEPLFESPPTDRLLRERLRRLLALRGPEHLHKMLSRLDRQSASRIQARDWSRTMRALEVRFQTRQPISAQRKNLPGAPSFASSLLVMALRPPREELYQRINRRADLMFERGLVDEVSTLIGSGIPADSKAFQAHGYRPVVEYLQGQRTLENALEQMKLDTRHYAKRQLSWWRGWPDVKWIEHFGESPTALAAAMMYLKEFKPAELAPPESL